MAHSFHPHVKAFGPQQLSFQLEIPAVAAKRTGRADDPVAWNAGVARLAHDGTDRPPGTWGSGERGDIAIRGHAAVRNAAYRGQHASTEDRCSHLAAGGASATDDELHPECDAAKVRFIERG